MSVELMMRVQRLAELLDVAHSPLSPPEVLDLVIRTLEDAEVKGVIAAGEVVAPVPPPPFVVGRCTAAVLMVAADEHGVVQRFASDPDVWRRFDTVYRWVQPDEPLAGVEADSAPDGCAWYHVASLGDDRPELDVLLDATLGHDHLGEVRAAVEATLTAWQRSLP